METHLIVAVHGIGEQKAGQTVDEIVGAATTQHGEKDDHFVPVTVDRDVIKLAEERFTKESGKANLFDVHVRRVRPASGGEQQAVFAEVFWADKSPAPQGAFRTIFDLLKVVLGLGYLAMENVESNRGLFSVFWVHAFTWMFYGFVAPMNAVLLIGTGLLLLELTPIWEGYRSANMPWIILVHGAVTLAVGIITRKRANTYLVRIFGNGMLIIGVLILVTLGLALRIPALDQGVCSTSPGLTGGIHCYAQFLLIWLGLSWFLVVGLALVITLTALNIWSKPPFETQRPHANVPGVRAIYPSICGAMLLFWMVITSSLWLLLRNVAGTLRTEITTNEDAWHSHEVTPNSLVFQVLDLNMDTVLQTVGVTTSGFIFVLLAAMALVALRKVFRKELYSRKWLHRIILHPVLQLLFILGLIMVAYALYALRNSVCPISGNAFPDFCWFREKNAVFTGALLVLGLVIYNLSHFVSGGLGILRDIVVYSTQGKCAMWDDTGTRRRNFTQRVMINNRFKRTLHYGLQTYRPTKVTIISHSQGTVIATQMLQDGVVQSLLRAAENPKVTLVTMGSPVTHIYRRYFKEFFEVSTDNMPLATRTGSTVKKAWYNIFREDDFVGTRIGDGDKDEATLAENHAVEPGGHSGYFTDFNVWAVLRTKVGFRLWP